MNPTNAAESISSMAVFGKTALVLIALIGVIILCGWLLRRLGVGYGTGSPALKIIASRAVGPRERVVLMEIENTWLLLGVGGGKDQQNSRTSRSARKYPLWTICC